MSPLCLAILVVLMAAANLAVALPAVTKGNLPQSARIEANPTNCENHIAILDIADQDAGRDGLIIVVGRLGNGERSRELNQHRLHSARAYLTEYRRVRALGTIVIAEGERVAGYGRIELYVGGKLHTSFAIRKNAELSVGSCELDDARQRESRKKLYPWRYQNQAPRP
jgi:hypothetical protein